MEATRAVSFLILLKCSGQVLFAMLQLLGCLGALKSIEAYESILQLIHKLIHFSSSLSCFHVRSCTRLMVGTGCPLRSLLSLAQHSTGFPSHGCHLAGVKEEALLLLLITTSSAYGGPLEACSKTWLLCALVSDFNRV